MMNNVSSWNSRPARTRKPRRPPSSTAP